MALRGIEEPIAVFEPWPGDVSAEQRRRYAAASDAAGADQRKAAALFDALAAEMPADPVPARLAQRLRHSTSGP